MNKVLMIGIWDWANTGWRFKRCLEYLGFNVTALKGHKHIFGYPEEMDIFEPLSRMTETKGFPISLEVPELRPFAEKADIIHMIASTFIDPGVNLKEKKTIVQHSGVTYTLESERGNGLFNSFADATIMQFPGLMGHGAKNEQLIIYPIDEEFIKPNFEKKSKELVIGHFPSNPLTKGTEKVLRVIQKLEKTSLKFKYIGVRDLKYHHTTWPNNLERMRKCDVVIETIKTKIYSEGRPGTYSGRPNGYKSCIFGDWGNTAPEASALGKVVITNCLHENMYKSEYGCDLPLHIANDEESLEHNLIELISMNSQKLLKEKKRHREWAVKNHGIKPTAERLWNKVYSEFF